MYKRIQIIALRIGKNIKELCLILNITPQGLSKYQNENKLSVKLSESFTKIGINPNWIETGEGDMFNNTPAGVELKNKYDNNNTSNKIIQNEFTDLNLLTIPKEFPLMFITVNASPNGFTYDDIPVGTIDIIKVITGGKNNIHVARATGVSMVDVGIFDNDYVIVERTISVNNGDLIICQLNGVNLIKRYCIDDGLTYLSSECKNVEKIIVMDSDNFIIFGKVLKTVHSF